MAQYTTKTEQQQQHELRVAVKKRSDRLINFFLPAYFLTGLVLAFFYDTWQIAIGVGGACLLAYYSAKAILPHSNLYQYVLGVVLGVFMAQYIYQMHGLFEMHFFAFIGSAILVTYQNWKLQIPMLIVVLVHHALFGYLQDTGLDKIYFTQLDYFELRTFIIHLLLAAVIFFVCGLWGYQLKKYSEIQVRQAIDMATLQKEAIIASQLEESNRRLTYASQATSDAIWDRNYTEQTVFWGDGYRVLFGYEITPETTSIAFWESKVHPDDLARILPVINEAKNNPELSQWSCEYRFMKADGRYAYVRERALILRDGQGGILRTIGALQDVTETKEHELALLRLNENLEKEKYFLDSLMDYMPDNIYFKDAESRLIRVSRHMAKHFDCSVEELIGKTDFDFQDQDHAKEAFSDEQLIQQTRKPKIDYVEKEIAPDGSERWVSTSKMPLLNGRGEIVGTFGISRDITRMKRLERERHAAEMDKAVAQGKFEIASDVMHDIGNAVVGFGSYLTRMKRLQDRDNADNLQRLGVFFEGHRAVIEQAIGAAKADAVIKMIASIAKNEKNAQEDVCRAISEQVNIITHIQEILDIQRQYISGSESKERKPVNMHNIINDSLAMIFGSIDKKSIDVSLNLAAQQYMIRGDRTKLMQLMLNVLKNSMEAMDASQRDKSIYIHSYTEAGQLVVEVKDTGDGFDPVTGRQLFTRGFTTKSTGSGLGLNNCLSIAESHEGSIDLTSEGKGKGALAKIAFSLPAA